MTKKIEPTEELVVGTTEEITKGDITVTSATMKEATEPELETTVTIDETVSDDAVSLIDKMKPYSDVVNKEIVKEGENFKEKLELGQIAVGTKISYVVSGGVEPTEVIVDDAFLSLPIESLEYYEKFNYKIV